MSSGEQYDHKLNGGMVLSMRTLVTHPVVNLIIQLNGWATA